MLFALMNWIKSEATPRTIGVCPFCNRKMISKCGEIVSWYWAHERAANCDSWYQPETEWHRRWKAVFGKDNSGIILNKDGIKHIADIITIHCLVIELQNSPINYETLIEREDFYGRDMVWIVNGIQFVGNFKICPYMVWSMTHTPPNLISLQKCKDFQLIIQKKIIQADLNGKDQRKYGHFLGQVFI